jgi:hypothetical protein
MRARYSSSKLWLARAMGLWYPYLLFLILGSVVGERYVMVFIALLLAVQLANLKFREISNENYRLAEMVRRQAVLFTALGCQPPQDEVRRLAVKLGVWTRNPRIEAEKYYASQSEPGPKRLIEIVEESAFWTSELADWTADRFKFAFQIAIALVIVILVACLYVGLTPEHRRLAGLCTISVINVLYAAEISATAASYRKLAKACDRIADRCLRLKGELGEGGLCEAMIMLDDYNCALASSPVLPEAAYKKNISQLNKAWAARCVV